jgi:hypothetical protein
MAVFGIAVTAFMLGCVVFPEQIGKPLVMHLMQMSESQKLRQRIDIAEPIPPGWSSFAYFKFVHFSPAAISGTVKPMAIDFAMIRQSEKMSSADALMGQMSGWSKSEHSRIHILPGEIQYQKIGGQDFATLRGDASNPRWVHAVQPQQYLFGACVLPSGNVINMELRESGDTFHPEKFKPILDQIKSFHDVDWSQ